MSLKKARPQMSRQLELPIGRKGEARSTDRSEEALLATHERGNPGARGLMELVIGGGNLRTALKRVRKNKGSPGVDGMTVGARSKSGDDLLGLSDSGCDAGWGVEVTDEDRLRHLLSYFTEDKNLLAQLVEVNTRLIAQHRLSNAHHAWEFWTTYVTDEVSTGSAIAVGEKE